MPLPLSPTMAVIDGRSASIASEKSSSATVLARSSNPPPNVLVTWRASSNAVMLATLPSSRASGDQWLVPLREVTNWIAVQCIDQAR